MTAMTRAERVYTALFALGITNLIILCVLAVDHGGVLRWLAVILDAVATAICGWRAGDV